MDEKTRKEYEEMDKKEQEKVYEYIKNKQVNELTNREIDVLVDRYVLGNTPSVNIHSKLPTSDNHPPNYSTKMEDAWNLLMQMEAKGWVDCEISTYPFSVTLFVTQRELKPPYEFKHILAKVENGYISEMPKAICFAALQAIETLKKEEEGNLNIYRVSYWAGEEMKMAVVSAISEQMAKDIVTQQIKQKNNFEIDNARKMDADVNQILWTDTIEKF